MAGRAVRIESVLQLYFSSSGLVLSAILVDVAVRQNLRNGFRATITSDDYYFKVCLYLFLTVRSVH